MKLANRLLCAVFGHKDELESKHVTKEGITYLLLKCRRCGQTSWNVAWNGILGMVAIWDRALTSDEIRILSEITPTEEDRND